MKASDCRMSMLLNANKNRLLGAFSFRSRSFIMIHTMIDDENTDTDALVEVSQTVITWMGFGVEGVVVVMIDVGM